jgi:hypothetical protein
MRPDEGNGYNTTGDKCVWRCYASTLALVAGVARRPLFFSCFLVSPRDYHLRREKASGFVFIWRTCFLETMIYCTAKERQ